MKTFFEKLLDLANMLLTGFIITYIVKPEFEIFWKRILPICIILYIFSTIALFYIEKKELGQYYKKRRKYNGD